ncbi:MAG: hypothetical protein NZ699_11930 [Roseiflexus sp.]|nr:hypothetical protein [Roseiflexus sp.]MCS7289831.1 hypothetical protein [Roseiflexus sp.]MDW8146932.1 hypothetical protein [Roseiflexaceae bacterium]
MGRALRRRSDVTQSADIWSRGVLGTKARYRVPDSIGVADEPLT